MAGPTTTGGRFELVMMVDWSAAATPGPLRPAPDRCWLAWGRKDHRPPAEYFPTRRAAVERIADLLETVEGNALVGWDFPHGYPHGAGLGGGRPLARRLAALIEDGRDGANNRFAVAAQLNREIGRPPGPFWCCPAAAQSADLTAKKPSFAGRPFGEWRIVDRLVRERGRNIQSTWKLYTTGSVGSQVLVGMPAIHALMNRPALAVRSRLWPFETRWDGDLGGIIHAEMWPSLIDQTGQDHPIKDARQVMAVREWMLRENKAGRLGQAFRRPPGLTPAAAEVALGEEGWILGVA